MTAFFRVSRKFLTVFYDGIIFPDTLCRKENYLSFQKDILDDDVPHIPNGLEVQVKEVPVIGQIMFLQK